MTEKEAILRDLKVIAILDDKIDYSSRESIGSVLRLDPRSLFSTEYGSRYLARIRKMYNGEDYDRTCILCGSPLDGDGPICSSCYRMITTGDSDVPQKPEPIQSEEPEQTAEEDSATETDTEEQVSADTTPVTPVTPIVSFDEARAAEEKAEKGFEDDAAEVQQTYDELEQNLVDPKAKKIYAIRAVVMLFVIACFAIGIVAGLALMIKRAGGSSQSTNVVIERQAESYLQEYEI